MDVLSPFSNPNSKHAPYAENHDGGGEPHNLYTPLNSIPGFTLLRGHIKLMAMVPNLPEHQGATSKPWSQGSSSTYHNCCGVPSSVQSFPPLTPRMMPSISQKYWRPQHLLPPACWDQKAVPPQGTYYHPTCFNTSVWPSRNTSIASPPPVPLMPSTSSVSFPKPVPALPTTSQQHLPMSPSIEQQQQNLPMPHVHHPSVVPQLQPSQAPYQMMNSMPSHENFSPMEYPYHPSYSGLPYHHYHPFLQQQMNFLQDQHQLSPYAAAPYIFDGRTYGNPSQEYNTFNMYHHPHPQQHCGSTPTAVLSCSSSCCKKSSKKTPRKSKKTAGKTEETEACIVIEEEEEVSSSSSLSSTEKYEIRRKERGRSTNVAPETEPSTTPQPTEESPISTNNPTPEAETEEIITVTVPSNEDEGQTQANGVNKSNNQLSMLTKGKKAKDPIVVTVHDCFLSDSSEAEQDPEQLLSDMDGIRKGGKRKPAITKNHKGGITEVFEDLDSDLHPDEVRTFTCDYIVELLSSQDWNECYIALQIVVRLARHRPQTLMNHLHENGMILWCTFKHITSPKSALCRAAILTFKELFEKIPGALDNHLDKVAEKLVVKSLAPNKFIRVECEKALMAMVEHGNLVKVLGALESMRKKPQSRAPGLKMALAKMALQVVRIAGVDLCLMNSCYAEKLLPMLFCFMMEPNSGVRTIAKDTLGMLMNHLQFEAAVVKHVTFDRNATEVFQKLEKMKGRCNSCNHRSHHHHHQRSCAIMGHHAAAHIG